MNKQEFLDRIAGSIDASHMSEEEVAATGEWWISEKNDPIDAVVYYVDTQYTYMISILNLDTDNPPKVVDGNINFGDMNTYEPVDTIPNEIGIAALACLPIKNQYILPVAMAVGTVGVLALAAYGIYKYKK